MTKKMKCPWVKGNKITGGANTYTILEVFPDGRVKYSNDENPKRAFYDAYRDLIVEDFKLSNPEPNYDSILDAVGNIVDELMVQHYGKQVTDIKEGDILLDEFEDEYEVRLIINGLYFLVDIKNQFALPVMTRFEVDEDYSPKPKKHDVNDLIGKVLEMIGGDITYRF